MLFVDVLLSRYYPKRKIIVKYFYEISLKRFHHTEPQEIDQRGH